MGVSRRDFISLAALGAGAALPGMAGASAVSPVAPPGAGSRPDPDPQAPSGNAPRSRGAGTQSPPRNSPRPQGAHPREASGTAGISPHRFDPWVEILPENLAHNVREVARLAGERPILAVVKNNAYGLGLEVVGPLLDADPAIQGFAVVKGEEALTLRRAGVAKPILLMGMFDPEVGPDLARAGVQLSLFTPGAGERVDALIREPGVGASLEVQLYLDTGMGRMGMPWREALDWAAALASRPYLRIGGAFTELSENRELDAEQIRRFLAFAREAQGRGVGLGPLHAAASNGVFHFPGSHLDMVRPGIALFGAYPSEPELERPMASLLPAVRLRARVVRVAQLQAGESVGYHRAWTAHRPTWTATLPVGHVDGYRRESVGGAKVLINGRFFPVIGGVSASHCIVNLGEEPLAGVGDVATFMGPGHPELEPNRMADALEVSVYDLLMHLNPRLPRVLVQETLP
jgi:alanine racemase